MLEVVNGITFLTPLWLRRPRVALVHHIHRDHYVAELGRPGAVAALLAETLPLRAALPRHHVPHDLRGRPPRPARARAARRTASTSPTSASRSRSSRRPSAPPSRACSTSAGSSSTSGSSCCSTCVRGDPRTRTWTSPATATTGRCWRPRSPRRGLGDRVTLHGHVTRGGEGRAAVERLGQPDRVLGRGLVPDGDGGRDVPHAERGAARSAGCPSRSSTAGPACSPTTPAELTEKVRALVTDHALRERLGDAALARAREFTWDRTAQREPRRARARGGGRARRAARLDARLGDAQGGRAWRPRRSPPTRSRCCSPCSSRACSGADGYGSLAALISTFLILAVPGSALQVVVARETATGTLGDGHPARVDARRMAADAAARDSSSWRVRLAAAARRRWPRCCRSSRSGRPPRRCRPAACGCCSRSSAARCRACTPTARSAGRSCSRRAGGSSPACCSWRPGSASPAPTWARRSRWR